MSTLVVGKRIKVEKLYDKSVTLSSTTEVYNNKVKIIALGVDVDNPHLKVGQTLLLMNDSGYDQGGSTYITENQILEIIGES
jgi:hypothetical protein